jgi:DNA-binding NtrC family response regulator
VAPFTLEEARAVRLLADRISALLAVSSALSRSRERELGALENARVAEQENQRLSRAVVGQSDENRHGAGKLSAALRRTTYSPAARASLDDLETKGRTNKDIWLVVPPGVDGLGWAAHAHLSSSRAGGPLVVVDATRSGETEQPSFLDSENSPFARASGGSLVLVEPRLLPQAERSELQRLLAHRGERESAALPALRVLVLDHGDPGDGVLTDLFPAPVLRNLEESVVRIPALAERSEDFRALVLAMLARHSVRTGREPLGIDTAALRILLEHSWPGNDLELEAVLLRAALAARGPVVTANELDEIGFRGQPSEDPEFSPLPAVSLRRAPRRFPRSH